MKVDFSPELKNLDGETLKERLPVDVPLDGKVTKWEFKLVTLKYLSVNALLGIDNEEKIDGNEKLDRYRLAMKINEATGPIELKAEEIAKIKKLIAKGSGPLVVGQAYEMLEGEKEKGKNG